MVITTITIPLFLVTTLAAKASALLQSLMTRNQQMKSKPRLRKNQTTKMFLDATVFWNKRPKKATRLWMSKRSKKATMATVKVTVSPWKELLMRLHRQEMMKNSLNR
ncbi:unnamed protein product [Microthlaspi erraticum]|uniref:Secreted protein n=1 Tax=Microthlaspi erraticum TaxID=1685480 RepID=A0A6D2K4L6_9BRAS|nr:unnamed protein product [Microthlaspi erraticum]